MKYIIFSLIYLTTSFISSGQNFEWGITAGGTSTDDNVDTEVDSEGNVYVLGIFIGTVDFNPGPGISNLTSLGGKDVYLQKLTPDGDLIWAKNICASPAINSTCGLEIDSMNNIYTAGYFTGVTDFDPGAGAFNLTSSGGEDIYIQKLNEDGDLIWAINYGSTSTDLAYSIELDCSNDLLITGEFFFTTDFDPGPAIYNLTSAGSRDIFVQKLDSAGSFIWAVRIGGTDVDADPSITSDCWGNVLVTGQFTLTVDFNPGIGVYNLNATGTSGPDVFVLKLTSSGNFIWAKKLGNSDYEQSNSIVCDTSGNVYFVGMFFYTVDMNPGPAVYNVSSAGGNDMFLEKLDSAGNFVWVKILAGGSSDNGFNLITDFAGNIYCAGYFSGTVDFDLGPDVHNLSSNGGIDIFFQQLNNAGEFGWAVNFGGSSDDFPGSMAIDSSESIYLSGEFKNTIDLNPEPPILNSTAIGQFDIFTVKLSHAITTCNLSSSDISSDIIAGLDGSIDITPSGTHPPFSFNWSGPSGFTASSEDLAGLDSGYYYLEIIDAQGCQFADSVYILYPCDQPDIPSIYAYPAAVCSPGDSVEIFISSGNLNDATTWHWYTGFCGSVEIDTGTSIKVSPTSNKFYYVRGEGSCAGHGSCAGIMIPFTSISSTVTSSDEIFGFDGTINLVPSGGIPPLSYSWSGPNSFISSTQDLTGLASGNYYVEITDAYGCIHNDTIQLNSQLGLIDVDNSSFLIYPNPSAGIFTLHYTNFVEGYQVNIYDFSTRLIQTLTMNNAINEIDLTLYQSGIYVVEIRDSDSRVSQIRIVKI